MHSSGSRSVAWWEVGGEGEGPSSAPHSAPPHLCSLNQKWRAQSRLVLKKGPQASSSCTYTGMQSPFWEEAVAFISAPKAYSLCSKTLRPSPDHVRAILGLDQASRSNSGATVRLQSLRDLSPGPLSPSLGISPVFPSGLEGQALMLCSPAQPCLTLLFPVPGLGGCQAPSR